MELFIYSLLITVIILSLMASYSVGKNKGAKETQIPHTIKFEGGVYEGDNLDKTLKDIENDVSKGLILFNRGKATRTDYFKSTLFINENERIGND